MAKKITVKVAPKDPAPEVKHPVELDPVNEAFDNTYKESAGKGKKRAIYKEWWFWCVAAFVAAAIAACVYLYQSNYFGSSTETNTVTVSQVVSSVADLAEPNAPVYAAVPAGALVEKTAEGKWALLLDQKVLDTFTGIAENDYGAWYIEKGYVNFDYSGPISFNGTTYQISSGKVVGDSLSVPTTTNAPSAAATTSAAAAPTTTVAATSSVATGGTGSQNAALIVAEDFLGKQSSSRSWLIAELRNDGYSEEDAAWAADHLNVDWNDQAYKKAQEYLNLTSFNYNDMVTQLEFEGFTTEQAQYGAKKAGL